MSSLQSIGTTTPLAMAYSPWHRIHLDFAGPVRGKMLLVVVDAHSKWPEVFPMVSTTAPATIRVLRSLFATYGLPRQVVSDNGPQFISEEFKQFLASNGVKHIKSSLYHPSTNGAAEQFIRTLKRALKNGNHHDLHLDLMTFLMSYRISPHATTSTPPCELFLKRTIRTRLDLIRPDLGSNISDKQSSQKSHHDIHSRRREFFLGQRVMARNYSEGPRWIAGTIAEKRGPLTYLVQIREDILWKRHIDQLIQAADTPDDVSSCASPPTPTVPVLPAPLPLPHSPVLPEPLPLPHSPDVTDATPEQPAATNPVPITLSSTPTAEATTLPRRYPLRQNRRPPKRFEFPDQPSAGRKENYCN